MSALYILFSHTRNKYYVGITTETTENRLKKHHESNYGKNSFTSTVNDWSVVLDLAVDSIEIARKMENYIKKMKSRKFIEKIVFDVNERNVFINKFLHH